MRTFPSVPRSVPVLVAIGLLGFTVAAYSAVELNLLGPVRFHGTPYPDAPPAPDFVLTDQAGSTLGLSDLRGRAVLLYFGFSRCPDVCPLTLHKISRVLAEAGIDSERVEVVMITVDPENDTPARLEEYVGQFSRRVRALTGERGELEALFARYGVYAQPMHDHEAKVSIAHTDLLFGIDRTGRLRVLIHATEPGDVVLRDVKALLR